MDGYKLEQDKKKMMKKNEEEETRTVRIVKIKVSEREEDSAIYWRGFVKDYK